MQQIIDHTCKRLQCTPEEKKCKKCYLYLISRNAMFRFRMGWYYSLYSLVKHYYTIRNQLPERVKRYAKSKYRPMQDMSLEV